MLPQPPVIPVEWSKCGSGRLECGSLSVPLNYAAPTGERITVALIRSPATAKAGVQGSIVLNPGGPGGSGLDLVRSLVGDGVEDGAGRRLNRLHALVSFDPRGVGKSTAVKCAKGGAAKVNRGLDDQLQTPVGFAQRLTTYIAGCQSLSGTLLPFLGTLDVARDMEQLRLALGEPKLNFLGYSYGTFLGATYAALFPDSAGRMVLDGAIDPDQYANRPLENDLEQAAANEKELGRFFTYWKHHGRESNGKPQPAGASAYRRLVRRLAKRPLRSAGPLGRITVTADELRYVVIEFIATRSLWPLLSEGLNELVDGNGYPIDSYSDLLDQYSDLDADQATFLANMGIDRVVDPAAITDAYVAQARAAGPSFPDDIWTATQAIALWPRAGSVRFAGPWTYPAAPGRTPALVIGNTFDPRTPYDGAVALTAQLGNARLLTLDGDGHTAFAGGNGSCIDKAVLTYFNTAALPRDGTRCKRPGRD